MIFVDKRLRYCNPLLIPGTELNLEISQCWEQQDISRYYCRPLWFYFQSKQRTYWTSCCVPGTASYGIPCRVQDSRCYQEEPTPHEDRDVPWVQGTVNQLFSPFYVILPLKKKWTRIKHKKPYTEMKAAKKIMQCIHFQDQVDLKSQHALVIVFTLLVISFSSKELAKFT